MIRFLLRMSVLMLLACAVSGCTDFIEPNQLAFVMGTAVDHADDGEVEVSHQIVIPTQKSGPFGGSGDSDSFVVMSAKGKNEFEAIHKVQKKMTRRLMPSHRQLIAISEQYFQKDDVSTLFDKLNRDPANNLRDITVLVKGDLAKNFLLLDHPMEHLSSIATGKEMEINGMNRFSTRQFIIDSLSEGTRPLVPVLQIEQVKVRSKETGPIAALSGFAALNKKLKIAGFLNDAEGAGAVWMSGKGTFHAITLPWKNGKDTLSFRLTHLRRRIDSADGHDPQRVVLTVMAQAYLLENTTSLDLSETHYMLEVQKYMNDKIREDLQLTMDKVQEWGSDVFGIGEYLHRSSPYWWKSQKDDWDHKFEDLDVTVRSNVQLRSVGASGTSFN